MRKPPTRTTSILVVLLSLAWRPVAAAQEGDVAELLAEDRWVQALELAETRHAREPDAPGVETELGLALLRAGEVRQAEAVLTRAVEASTSPRAMVALGRIRVAAGRRAEAVELMLRAVEAAPRDPYVLYWATHAPPSRARAKEWLERFRALAGPADADRLEAVEGTLGLFAARGGRSTWIPDSSPSRAEMGLRLLGGQGAVTGLVIEARLAGRKRPVRLLLDSGSPGLVVMERMVRKGGFEPITEETSFGGGGDQRHEVRRGLLRSVDFGGVSFRDAVVTTTRYELDPYGRYHGVVGLSVFDGYRLRIEPARRRMIVERSDGESTGDPYWTFSGQMLVEVDVGGDRRGLFLFDTGASRTVVSNALAQHVEGVSEKGGATLFGFGGVREGSRTVRGLQIRFQGIGNDGRPLPATDLALRSKMGGVEISGFLGLDLLGYRSIVVDTAARSVSINDPAP